METFVITIHYFLCFSLIMIILLQAGKGADIGAVFGGASQTVFGGRGPTTFMNKITVGIAVGFLVTSVWLAHISKTRSAETVIDKATVTEKAGATEAKEPAGEKAEPTQEEKKAVPEADEKAK